MNMQRLRLILLGVMACLALVGCDSAGTPILQTVPPAAADVFGAQQEPASANDTIVIGKAAAGSISVVAYPPTSNSTDEVALDYIVMSRGNSHEAALQAARQQPVNFRRVDGNRVEIDVPAVNDFNSVQVNVRVPEHSSVEIKSSTGDVSIFGPVRNVMAHLGSGHIEARGALGNVELETGQGNIQSAQRSQAATLVLSTTQGDITTFAVNAMVKANIVRAGSIRFVGTLRDISEFRVKGDGNVTVVLPESTSYFVRAIGGESVSVDYAAEAEVCGIYSGPGGYHYETQPTGDRYGRVETRKVISGDVGLVEGTMGKDFYFFTTTRPEVVIAPPPPGPIINIAPPSRQSMGVCSNPQQPLDIIKTLPPPPVTLQIWAENGLITVHYINMK